MVFVAIWVNIIAIRR